MPNNDFALARDGAYTGNVFIGETTVASFNLKSMSVDALLKLRADIDTHLAEQRRELERQLARLAKDSVGNSVGNGRRRGRPRKDVTAVAVARRSHPLRGKKRPPKFRDPESGNTWAGVGMIPRWLANYEIQGRKREEFAVGDSVGATVRSAVKKSGQTRKKGKRGRPKKKAA
jgi:DNA-binding protein H-NS